MADQALSALSALTPIPGAALVYVVDGGVGYKGTVSDLRAGGAMTLIETLSPSGVASIDSEAFAGDGYKELLFVINLTVSSDNSTLQAQYKLNGAYKTGANYRRVLTATDDTPTSTVVNASGSTVMFLSASGAGKGIGNDTLESYGGEMRVFNPDGTSKAKHMHVLGSYINSGGLVAYFTGGGTYTGADAANALQGVRFIINAGTMTGTIQVFGR